MTNKFKVYVFKLGETAGANGGLYFIAERDKITAQRIGTSMRLKYLCTLEELERNVIKAKELDYTYQE